MYKSPKHWHQLLQQIQDDPFRSNGRTLSTKCCQWDRLAAQIEVDARHVTIVLQHKIPNSSHRFSQLPDIELKVTDRAVLFFCTGNE